MTVRELVDKLSYCEDPDIPVVLPDYRDGVEQVIHMEVDTVELEMVDLNGLCKPWVKCVVLDW